MSAIWRVLLALNERLTLFYKIQIASTLLLAIALWLATVVREGALTLVPLLLLLVLATAIVNSAILRAALAPAERLRGELSRVRDDESELCARGDPMTRDIAKAVNAMIRRLRESRREAALTAFQAEQAERSRIAHDLHDDVSQRVAALARGIVHLAQAPSTEIVPESSRLADEALTILELLRRTMSALHPLVLDDLGLQAALSWLVQNEVPQLEAHLSLDDSEVDGLAAAVLFRVAQEALTNVGRHARARTVWVRTTRGAGELSLEVEDDGTGMSPDGRLVRGYGLRSMRERVEGLGGTLEVWSRPQRGTAIRAVIPLQEGRAS